MSPAQIMVVEDESIVAKDINHRLKSLGYQVPAMASSGAEAIKKASQTLPDLVLMDIRLKGDMDGVETAEQIRRRFNIPVVYLTAYADNPTLQRAKVTEPFGYILKPFEERELHTCIEVALYKHQMERKLRESEQWLATTLRCIGDGVMATDMTGRVKFINRVGEALTGWTQTDALDKDIAEVFHTLTDDPLDGCAVMVTKAIRQGHAIEISNRAILVAKDGTGMPIDYSAASIRGDRSQVAGVVVVFRDVTERRQTEEKLRYLSTHDILTGLYNRAYFEEEMLRLERGRHFPVSVIMTDIDGFKMVNDTDGHAAGDTLLRDAARVLKTAFRGEDVVTRFGGDEFAVLLPGTNAESAAEATARVRNSVAAYNNVHAGRPLMISLGSSTAESGQLADALKEADKRMYQEKMHNRLHDNGPQQ
jgi:diguanylate cyclase (GGDEF)-like protein/PAS domain S-box-containing protein